ncbi:uncharacterized protein LOC108598199 [Drosophila busckii]|nr:uncharacterized protein LOC108598199 [Drosophila busckii]
MRNSRSLGTEWSWRCSSWMAGERYRFTACVRKVLKKGSAKMVTQILNPCTKYVDAIDACGTPVSKDVLAIANASKSMIGICNKIVHLSSMLCNNGHYEKSTDSAKMCSWQLFKAVDKLTDKLNTTSELVGKLVGKLAVHTSFCFMGATNEVRASLDNVLPGVNIYVDNRKILILILILHFS